jgi:3-keto-5-aminohexanoate cleavage enzyme
MMVNEANSQPKLIITATVAPSWLYPEAGNNPKTPEDAVEEALGAWKAGAAVVHIHGSKNFAENEWKMIIKSIRDRSDVVIQAGLSALSIPERMAVIKLRPDMISVILNHHDEAFPRTDMSLLHPRSELEDYGRLCNKYGIKPEFEVWHSGSVWNLNYLVEKGLVDPPYFVTLFFDWPGGIWSPASAEELMHRLRNQRRDAICSVSIMSNEQTRTAVMSILLGHHVRVGTEDNPYYEPDRLAKNNAELVARMVRIANEIGRPVANPEEARRIIGIKRDVGPLERVSTRIT